MNADDFNAHYPIGTPVLAYPGIRPEHPVAIAFQKRANDGRTFGTTDPCKRLVTRTRTPAWTLGHGEPVVSVDGYAGGIVLDHVDVISEEEFAKARAEETAAAVAAQGALPVPVGDQPQLLGHATPAETVPALMATINELRDLRAPLIDALRTVYQSMTSCVGDEWAMEWLGEVWTQIPLNVRALAGDTDAAVELAASPIKEAS